MAELDPEFAALLGPSQAQAAPAAAAPASGLDPEFAALMGPSKESSAPAQSPSALGPWASAAVRPIAKAVTALPLMAADAGITMGNYIRPSINSALGLKQVPDLPLMQPTFNNLLDKYTQQPQGIANQAAEGVSTALAGAKLPMPTGIAPTPATAPQAAAGLTGAQQQAMQGGAAIGMRTTPGQATGSRALQQVEAKLESQPWSSGPFNALKSGNQEALNRVAARSIGEDSPTVDATVLDRAAARLSNTFSATRSSSKTLQVDPKETAGVLDKINSEFEGLLPGDMAIHDNKLVAQLSKLTQSGNINGQQLGQLASKLGRSAYKQMSGPNGDRDLGKALFNVKDHVDDLVERTLSGDEAAEYAQARQQYRALMQLTSRVGTINPSTGHVSGGALANYLQQTDRNGYLYGRNQSPLYQGARFAQAFKPIVGDSGTATRSPNLFNPVEIAAGIPANLFSRLYLSSPGAAMTRGALTAAKAPRLLARPGLMGGLIAAQSSEAGQ